MRQKLFVFVCFLALASGVILLWPAAGYDLSRVHPKLRELSAPYQSVKTGYYLDGGSISVTIVDRDGRKLELALPVSGKNGRISYPQLFIGGIHVSKTNTVEVEFTEDTRRMLIATIEEHRTTTDDSDIALIRLRGASRDYARILPRIAVNIFSHW